MTQHEEAGSEATGLVNGAAGTRRKAKPLTLRVFRRQVGLVGLVGLIFFTASGGPFGLEQAIGSSGPGMAVLLILLVPLILAVPAALMSAELSAAIPLEGGYYYWAKAAFGPFAAFIVGLGAWFTSFLDTALYPVLFVDYLATWFPALGRGQGFSVSTFNGQVSLDLHWLIAVAFMIPLALLNARGIRLVGDASAALTVVILLPFVVVTILGVAHIIHTGASPLAPFVAKGQAPAAAFAAGLAVVIWNYVGFDKISTAGGEVDRPARTYPLALAIAVPLIMLTYLLPMVASLASGLHHHDPSQWTQGDFARAAGMLGGDWLQIGVLIAAGVSNIGLFSACLLATSRLPAVLAADRLLPAPLARVHPRYGTPVVAITVSVCFFAVFCSMSFKSLLNADIMLGFGVLALEFLALLVLRRRYPAMNRPFRIPGGWPVLALVVFLPTLIGIGVLFATISLDPFSAVLGLGAFALCALLYPVSRRIWKQDRPDADVDLDAVDFGPGTDPALILEGRPRASRSSPLGA